MPWDSIGVMMVPRLSLKGPRSESPPTDHSHGAAPALHWLRRRAVAKSTGPRDGVCIKIVPSSGVSYTVRPGQVLKLPLFNESILDRPRRPRPCLQSPARADRGHLRCISWRHLSCIFGGCPGALYSTRRGSFPARKWHT